MDPLFLEALAQLETAGGKKTIKGPNGEDSNNLFNIKDFSGGGFRAVDRAEGSNDAYRVYASREAATEDLVSLLSRKYPRALEATNAEEFATALKDGGYATDPEYVAKFVGVHNSLSTTGERAVPVVPPAKTGPTLGALYAAAQGPRPPAKLKMTQTAGAVQALAQVTPQAPVSASDDWYRRASTQWLDAEKAQREREQQHLIDIARAQFMGTFAGTALKALTRKEFDPQPGFTVQEADLEGLTMDQQSWLRSEAQSPAELAYLKGQIEETNDRMREAGKSGLGWAIMGGVIAGGPEAVATGVGTSALLGRIGLGSAALARAGRLGASVVSTTAENVGTSLAMTAVQDYLTPDVTAQDYIIGAVMDSVGVAATLPGLMRAARAGGESAALSKILDDALQSKVTDIAVARRKLGPDAEPGEVAKEAVNTQAERIRAPLEDAKAALPGERRLLSDDVLDELAGEPPKELPPPKDTTDISTPDSSRFAGRAAEIQQAADLERAAAVQWDSPLYLQHRANLAEASDEWKNAIKRVTDGRTYAEVQRLPPGVHVSDAAAGQASLRPAVTAIKELAAQYLPDSRVHVGTGVMSATANGEALSVGDVHMISLRPGNGETVALHTGMHELGHAVFHENARFIPADLMRKIQQDYARFVDALKANAPEAMWQRYAVTSEVAGTGSPLKVNRYNADFDEYLAEQYVKHIEARALRDDARLTSTLRQRLVNAIKALLSLFSTAKAKGLIAVDEGADEFFRRVLDGTLQQTKRLEDELLPVGDVLEGAITSESRAAARTDEDIIRDYGLDTLAADMQGGGSATARAELKAMVQLYRKAEAYPMPDEARMSKLLSSAPLQWAAPTALTLMRSKNPVARMVAAELLESGGGAGGRHSTAAVAKWMLERQFLGNSVNDIQTHYAAWRNANGGSTREDFLGGKKWEEFNRLVATEIENRRAGRVSQNPPAVHAAADVLEAAYDRMRQVQVREKTPGWQALPESSFGYMPHRMSPAKIRAMTPDQGRVLHSVLVDQFVSIEGFDPSFSNRLASKYIDVVRKRGTAGYGAPLSVHNAEAGDIVEQAILAMGMTREEAHSLGQRVRRAAPAHTRGRLDLDLTSTHVADGKSFQLLDLFETDQLALLRSQAGRVSGEAALMRHGIPGSTGLKLLRRSLDFGKADGKVGNAELEAFDQVSAELLGQPFGNQGGRWLDRALQFNSLASLGGMGFNQLAETLNGAVALGVRHALASVGSFGRLRSEILALSKGKKVNNPIIGSLETYGAEFGTDHYKMVFPFDNPERGPGIYGVDDLTVADRLLRAGTHLQGKLSLWRAITSAQERGMAEQIVHKALRYIREGQDSIALADMGISPDLMKAIKAELPQVAKFSGGRLVEFDITKMQNQTAANEFVQAVHRGTRQIIQGAFIGETGKWAHNGLLKLLTQFRTFSLVAIDKQWNRQVGNHGTAAALGILLGTMAFAAPIVMIRAGIQSVGRPDQDEFLEKKLDPVSIARDTLNYVALSGLSGDLLDALSAVAGVETTGGRTGTNKALVGNVVAPAVGRANDIWGALQNTKDGNDIHGLIQQLPFSRLPWLYPAVNALRD